MTARRPQLFSSRRDVNGRIPIARSLYRFLMPLAAIQIGERNLRLKALQDKADAAGMPRAQLNILHTIGRERAVEVLDDAWFAHLKNGGPVWQ
jgi:hypothetical protein